MNAGPAIDMSLVDGYQTEWQILSEHPLNVMLEGTPGATDSVLCLLRPHIREPTVWHQPHARLNLPSVETRALVLRDIAALSRDEQRQLLAWMDGTGSRTQIISTTARPLLALVAGGQFDAALYYRLNVMLLRISASYPAALPRGVVDAVPHSFDNPMTISPRPPM